MGFTSNFKLSRILILVFYDVSKLMILCVNNHHVLIIVVVVKTEVRLLGWQRARLGWTNHSPLLPIARSSASGSTVIFYRKRRNKEEGISTKLPTSATQNAPLYLLKPLDPY